MGKIATNNYIKNIVGSTYGASGSKCPPVSEIKTSDSNHKLDWTKFPSTASQLVEESKIVLGSTGFTLNVQNSTGFKVLVEYDSKSTQLAKGASATYTITGGSIKFQVVGSSFLSVRGIQSGQEYNGNNTPLFTLQTDWCVAYGDLGVTLRTEG